MKVLVSTSSFGTYDKTPIKKLESRGLEVMLNPYQRKLTREESLELLQGVSGLIAGTESLSRPVLDKAKSLKVISRCGVGMDNVDLATAQSLNIMVVNTPDAPTQAVAELSISLIFALLRRIVVSDYNVKKGQWVKSMGTLLQDKTLGIVGLGRIGKRLCQLLSPFGLKIVAYDVQPDIAFASALGIKLVSLDQLLEKADVVTVHVSSSQCLLDKNELAKMKNNAVIINVSRGGVVDEIALADTLKRGGIAGAALDVFKEEPYAGPLAKCENVILTPHIGSYAVESRVNMENMAVDNLLRAFEEIGLI